MGVARSSLKRSRTVGARGCFHSQALPTSLHSFLISGVQRQHSVKRWWRDCRLPLPHHQQSLEGKLPALSARKDPIAAWPESNWKYLAATSFRSRRRCLRSLPPGGGLVSALCPDVVLDPVSDGPGPSLGGLSGEVREACLLQVLPVHSMPVALCCRLGKPVCLLVARDPHMGGGQSNCGHAPPLV